MRRSIFGLVVLIGAYLVWVQIAAGRPLGDVTLSALAFAIYGTVAGLIVFRRDGHITGWILALLGVLLMLGDASPYLPGADEAVVDWIGSWVWTAVFALFGVLTLTFPGGHPPQGRGVWPRLGRVAIVALPLLVLAAMTTETLGGPMSGVGLANRLGFLPGWLTLPILGMVVAILVAGAISLIVKRRRATGVERAQITWVVFGLGLLVTTILLTFAFIIVLTSLGYADPGDPAWGPVWVVMITFPLWFGIAILRYRLFEIDRIISRTVAYTMVIALLAAVFATVVTVLTSLLPSGSNLRVAASTLVVAAMFNPVRRNLQRVVDRRFNRSHYDAMRVGLGFADSVRDEVDPNRIVDDWVGVVTKAVEPATVSVWIKGDEDVAPT